jgi:hypothetical protein
MPAALYGKSVIVGWFENRTQTFEGESQQQYRHITRQLSIYISSAGRGFTKMHVSSMGGGRGRRGPRSAEAAHGPGDNVSSSGGARAVHFEGGALIVDAQLNSGARRVIVTFDTGYTGCSARVIYGKEGGAAIRATSMISGRRLQVHSLEISTPTCSVRAGNVFAGE